MRCSGGAGRAGAPDFRAFVTRLWKPRSLRNAASRSASGGWSRPSSGNRDGHGLVEPHELAAGPGRVGIAANVLLTFLAGHDLGMVEHVVEGPVRQKQLRRDLRPDQRHARHVVRRVTHEREIIDDLLRPYAPLGPQFVRPHERVRTEVEQPHPLRKQLPGVLVGRGEHAFAAVALHLPGDRGQDVVGLVAGHFQARDPHHREELPHERDLRHEVGRHLGPVGLVGLEPLVAKRRPRGVERAEQIVGLLLLDDVEQVAREAVDGRDGRALRRRHLGQRVKQLIGPRQRVDHPHRLPGEIGHGICRSGGHATIIPAGCQARRLKQNGSRTGFSLSLLRSKVPRRLRAPRIPSPDALCAHPWAPFARSHRRCAIHGSAGDSRRLNGRGNPSPPLSS